MGLFSSLKKLLGLEEVKVTAKVDEFRPVTLTDIVTNKSETVESEVKSIELIDSVEVKVKEPKAPEAKPKSTSAKPKKATRKPRAKKKA